MKIKDFENCKKFKFLPSDTDTNAVRLRELEWLAPFIKEESLCLEFGVFNGTTINSVAKARPDLTFHGFDSFEGLPEDWEMGGKHVRADAFDRSGVMPEVEDNVKLYKGWFDKTLPEFLDTFENPEVLRNSIGYLHVDCDIYSSTVTVMEELNHLIVPGTIIRFDELSCWRTVFGEASPSGKASRAVYTTWKEHEWKAMLEWMEKYNRKVIPLCRNWFQGGTVVVTQ